MQSGGHALHLRWTDNSRVMVRAILICVVLMASAVFQAQRLQGFDWGTAWRDLASLSAGQIGLALVAVATAFVAVAGQERAVLAHLALSVARLSLAAVPEFGEAGLLAYVLRRAVRGRRELDQFKSAFAPKWEVRYAAAPGWTALVAGGLEVAFAILRPARLGVGPVRWVVHRGGGPAKEVRPAERAA